MGTYWEGKITPKIWINTNWKLDAERLHNSILTAHEPITTKRRTLSYICAGADHLTDYISRGDDNEMPLSFWDCASLMVATLFRVEEQDFVQKAHEEKSLAIDKLSGLFDAILGMNDSYITILIPLVRRCYEILECIDVDVTIRYEKFTEWNERMILPVWSTADHHIISSSNPISAAIIGSAYVHAFYSLGMLSPYSNLRSPWKMHFSSKD